LKLSYYIIETSLQNRGLLLISTRFESYLILDEMFASKYLNYKDTDNLEFLDETLKEALIEYQMLIDDDEDEYAQIVNEHWSDRTAESDILSLTVATTLGCNLSCSYCFEKNKHPLHLSSEDEDSIFAFVQNRLRNVKEGLILSWFGGEPLLGIKSIERLSKRFLRLTSFSAKSYSASIITNGVLLTEENAKILKHSLVNYVQITMDGDKELHNKMRPTVNNKGSYDDVLKGVMVSRKYFATSIRINLNQNNLDSVKKLLHTLAELELFDVNIDFSPVVASEEDINRDERIYLTREEFANIELELSALLKKLGFSIRSKLGLSEGHIPCAALDPNNFVIEPNGTVHRCVEFVGNSSNPVGHLKEGKLSPLKYEDFWKSYNLFTLYQAEEEDDCNNCKYLPLCYGDCPTKRVRGHNKKKYICTPLRFNLEEMLKLELDLV